MTAEMIHPHESFVVKLGFETMNTGRNQEAQADFSLHGVPQYVSFLKYGSIFFLIQPCSRK